jgi:hypothetical protein
MILMRYSPFYEQLMDESVACRPLPVYRKIFPEQIDHETIALYCESDFESAARCHPELISAIRKEVERWQARWADSDQSPPCVSISPIGDGTYQLLDTRGLSGTETSRLITRRQAAAAMLGGRELSAEISWALDSSVCIELDSRYVPLATASYETYLSLKKGAALSPGS